jgi:hypothetical protein
MLQKLSAISIHIYFTVDKMEGEKQIEFTPLITNRRVFALHVVYW